jgi:hypothetical protein
LATDSKLVRYLKELAQKSYLTKLMSYYELDYLLDFQNLLRRCNLVPPVLCAHDTINKFYTAPLQKMLEFVEGMGMEKKGNVGKRGDFKANNLKLYDFVFVVSFLARLLACILNSDVI